MQELGLEAFQILTIFGFLFVISFGLLIVMVFNKQYQISNKWLSTNFTVIMAGLTVLAMSLGVFFIYLLVAPGYVIPIPIFNSDTLNVFGTFFIVSFIMALFSGLFLMYTKRGGL